MATERANQKTLREELAGLAMNAILSDSIDDSDDTMPAHVADLAVKYADALLQRLDQK